MQETSGACLQHQRGPGGGGRRDSGHLEVLGREGVGFQSLHYENLPTGDHWQGRDALER